MRRPPGITRYRVGWPSHRTRGSDRSRQRLALRTPPSAAEVPVRAFSFTPNGLANTDYAHRAVISPNGKYIAYVAENRLWLRDLASEQSKPVEGGENAEGPFWSPDSGLSRSPPAWI
jgi:hypothetical protein